MTLGSRRLVAKGDVRSLLQPTRRGAGAEKPGENPSKLPVILEDREPVNITAAALEYDPATSRATYTGDARLWQGETTIQADAIVLDDKTGDLSATRNVRTRMLLEQTAQGTEGKTETVETLGSSAAFLYEDSARRATYTGRAHVKGPQGDVTADRIVMFLGEDGGTLDRAEAYDHVVARLEGGQRAEGSRLTYFGADERYVMSGTPVKILEAVDDGCRETTGTALTFIRSTDTIAVVGTEGNRSRTTPGRCPERASAPPAGREMGDATPRRTSTVVERWPRGDAR
jgi:lipopolysaccharide export system protein LptA